MKKITFILVAVLVLAMIAAGCQAQQTPSQAPSADATKSVANDAASSAPASAAPSSANPQPEGKKRVAGIVVKALTGNSFQIDLAKALEAAAAKYGFDHITLAPQTLDDVTQQVDICETLITKKVDLIVIAPSDKTSTGPVLEKAMKAGIPVIAIDNQPENPNSYITFIGPDNKLAAYEATKFICEKMGGKGNFVHIEGDPQHEVAQLRKDGCYEALKEYPNVKMVASQTAKWTYEGGVTVMENALQANPDITGVFAANDDAILGAIEACKKKNVRPFMAGFDAITNACEAIKAGDLDASIAFFPETMADAAFRAGSAYINHLNDGQLLYLRQWINSGATLITAENVGMILDKK